MPSSSSIIIVLLTVTLRHSLLKRFSLFGFTWSGVKAVWSAANARLTDAALKKWHDRFYVSLPLALTRAVAYVLATVVFVQTLENEMQVFNVMLIGMATLSMLCFTFVQAAKDTDLIWRSNMVEQSSALRDQALHSGITLLRTTIMIVIAYALKSVAFVSLDDSSLEFPKALIESSTWIGLLVTSLRFVTAFFSSIFFSNGILLAARALEHLYVAFHEAMPFKTLIDD